MALNQTFPDIKSPKKLPRREFLALGFGIIITPLSQTAQALESEEVVRRLLLNGADASALRLGTVNGYWSSPKYRIGLPSLLRNVQGALKSVGQSKQLDDLHLKLNRAAEHSVPFAKELIQGAIRELSLPKAASIIGGKSTEATDYLRTKTFSPLSEHFQPTIKSAIISTGAVIMMEKIIKKHRLSPFIKTDAATYLARHATSLALGSFFGVMGEEEVRFRRDPAGILSRAIRL